MASSQEYKFVPYGGGVEQLDRLAVRDRIRSGDILPQSELAIAGTDEWKPAVSYPELVRYFEMAATRTVLPPATPAKPRDLRPMTERIVGGLSYPLSGNQVLTLVGVVVVSALPFIGIFGSLASTVIMLGIIRTSADGSLRMPPLIDTSDVTDMIRRYFQVLFVTLVSLAVPLALTGYAISLFLRRSIGAPLVLLIALAALAAAALYYPACLATVAVWDNALSALNPVYVGRVIRTIGSDYLIVIGMWFVSTLITSVMKMPYWSPLATIPVVGGLFGSALSLYSLFYASHLLGYAVFRHAPELGWE